MNDAPAQNTRLGIFISSTDDVVVREYRLLAREIIEDEEFRDKWYPVEMSSFSARTPPAAEVCKKDVLSCYAYVGIIGPIYGSVCESEGISYTELEYTVARDANRHIGIFLLPEELFKDEPWDLFKAQMELLPRQEAFRQRLQGHTAAKVSNLEVFRTQFRRFLRELAKSHDSEIMAAQTALPRPGYLGGYPDDAFDRRPILGYRQQQLDHELIDAFIGSELTQTDLVTLGLSVAGRDHQLAGLGLITEEGVALGAFFCFAPSRLLAARFGACGLHLVEYDGVDRGTSRTVDKREYADNLIRLHERGMEFLRTHLRRIGAVGRSERDELEIPIIALREALTNALIHRQYDHADVKDQPTRIEIYSDRVEIISFGGLVSGISADILNDAPEKVEPLRRNPVISKIFLNMTLAELGGSGIERIHFALRRSGLPKPVIYDNAAPSPSVKVVFQRPRRDQFTGAQIMVMEPGQLRAEVQRLLDTQKVRPTAPYIFAHAHSQIVRNIASEVDMRTVRGVRVPLVRGPKGSGIERIPQALAEAPKAGLPFPWPFDDAYCLSVARLLARKDARDVLDAAVKAVGSSSLLVLTEAREFDRDQGHEQQAQECIDYLIAEVPTNVLLVYPTDDNGNLMDTRLRRATFQDFTVEALLKTQTQQFVRDYFWEYWEAVDHVAVAADAFDDVYPVSPYIFEDDLHFNLPLLPIVLGSNAARTVKGGREAMSALVEAAQHRLDGARSAIRPNKSLTDAFARYFVTLQMELEALRGNPEPQARKGLLLVSREVVSAELAASAVYVFQWPDIEKMGRLAPIIPEPYPKP
jgi:hypothetical protein